MPATFGSEDDDPVVASYDIFMTDPQSSDNVTSRLYVLQYPAHRPQSKPYNVARSQKPISFKLKPETGMLEMEVPILTQENYNHVAGQKFGQAIAESRVALSGGSYGLASGFAHGPGPTPKNDPEYESRRLENESTVLATQTLGGKIAFPSQRDPLYMLGVLRNNEIHLSHMDAVVQMRPQLHHIDAEDELAHSKSQAASEGSRRPRANIEQGSVKLETKAIEMKIKDSKEDMKDRHLNENAKLLRKILIEQWQTHEWIDQDDETTAVQLEERLLLKSHENLKTLSSMMNNDEWLDKMSAPREDGKKGLRSKLKGRDRERARRKKVENQRRQANAAADPANIAAFTSGSDVSSSEHSDVEVVAPTEGLDASDIKQEPLGLAAAPVQVPAVPDPVPVDTPEQPPKRRGRSKKNAD